MPKRFIMRIELTGPAKNKLATLSDKHGMTQVAMMSRLVEWYAGQNELIQGRLSWAIIPAKSKATLPSSSSRRWADELRCLSEIRAK